MESLTSSHPRDLPQPRAYRQGIQLLSGRSWTLISLPRDPNTLELRAYRKEPDPHDIGDPNPLPGPSHLMPVLGDVLRCSSLLLRAQHP